jgi:hypothetical protein
MPDQIGDLIAGDGPVVGDTGDPPERVVALIARCVDLADDRVFGAINRGECGHRGADTVTPVVPADRFERSGRVG